jgi:two-component sensor histidine kinase
LGILARQAADYLERKRAEEVQEALVRELQHRSNNQLSVIQAIAHQTFPGDRSPKEFDARLGALAQANRQLTESNLSRVKLSEIVRLALVLGIANPKSGLEVWSSAWIDSAF